MKKFIFAVVIAAIAASPAAAAKKKKRLAPAPVASTNSNENSARFVRDSLPVFLPSWSIPIYLSAKNAQ